MLLSLQVSSFFPGICLWALMFVFIQVYEGAVYMNQGKTYLVKQLDLSSKIAWCQQADVKYYTKTRDYTDIHVIGGDIVCNVFKANTFFPSLPLWLSICF